MIQIKEAVVEWIYGFSWMIRKLREVVSYLKLNLISSTTQCTHS